MLYLQLDNDFKDDHYRILETEGSDHILMLAAIAKNQWLDPANSYWTISDHFRGRIRNMPHRNEVDCLPPGTDSVEGPPDGWPLLSPEHERSLREFTRKNYKRFSYLNPSCHPIVRDEARLIDDGF